MRKASRSAMIRTAIIGAILVYATYRMILWAETTEWGKMLEFIRIMGSIVQLSEHVSNQIAAGE